jgi:hypothetical protein
MGRMERYNEIRPIAQDLNGRAIIKARLKSQTVLDHLFKFG